MYLLWTISRILFSLNVSPGLSCFTRTRSEGTRTKPDPDHGPIPGQSQRSAKFVGAARKTLGHGSEFCRTKTGMFHTTWVLTPSHAKSPKFCVAFRGTSERWNGTLERNAGTERNGTEHRNGTLERNGTFAFRSIPAFRSAERNGTQYLGLFA
jgi:hypothetical protein